MVIIATTVLASSLFMNQPETQALEWKATPSEEMDIKGSEHTLIWGDTLYEIAEAINSDVTSILLMNQDLIKDPDLIYQGYTIKLPTQATVSHGGQDGSDANQQDKAKVKKMSKDSSNSSTDEQQSDNSTDEGKSNQDDKESLDEAIEEAQSLTDVFNSLKDKGYTDEEVLEMLNDAYEVKDIEGYDAEDVDEK